MYDSSQYKKLKERHFATPILKVLMVQNTLIVVFDVEIYVFSMNKDFLVEKHIRTYSNPRGLCAITSKDNIKILATVGLSKNELIIYNSFLNDETSITPFETELQSIEISLDVITIIKL